MKVSQPHAPEPHPDVMQDHDLPVLAVEEMAPVRPDWESLIEDSILPALLIDGERRCRGRR